MFCYFPTMFLYLPRPHDSEDNGIGRMKDGLYHLDIFSFKSPASKPTSLLLSSDSTHCNTLSFPSNLITCTVVSNDAWHKRLGHMSISRMYMLPFHEFICYLLLIIKSLYLIVPFAHNLNKLEPHFPSSLLQNHPLLFNLFTWTFRGLSYTHIQWRPIFFAIDYFYKGTWIYISQSKLDALVMIRRFFFHGPNSIF